MRGLLQFTLDLFSLDVAAPPAQAPRTVAPSAPSSPSAPTRRKAPRGPSRPSSKPSPERSAPMAELWSADAPQPAPVARGTPATAPRSPAAPPATLAQVLTPVSYRHPTASRELMLAGVHVAYAFRRGKRRTIGFSVGAEGLAVSAPKWVSLHEVDRAVHDKGDWILRKLQETRERQARIDATRVDWRHGAELPYLGQPLTLVLDPAHQFVSRSGQLVGEPGAQQLLLGLPHSAVPEQIRDAAQAWLMRRAKDLFEERLRYFAPRLGVRWRQLTLSSASTRWGSAKSDGSIRLHWRLIHFRPEVIDYVVVHELSHLRVMDHSPRFWDTVAAVVPDYDALRGELRELPIPTW